MFCFQSIFLFLQYVHIYIPTIIALPEEGKLNCFFVLIMYSYLNHPL